MNAEIVVRDSSEADIPAIHAIYDYYVLGTLATLEEETPSVLELTRRRAEALSRGFPYLTAQAGEEIVGYGYVHPYRARSAYRFTVEDSLYVKHGWGGRGIGRLLLGSLVSRCEAVGLRQMVAVIGDENTASIRLHVGLGFHLAGTLCAVGSKFGRSVDTVFLQRGLGATYV